LRPAAARHGAGGDSADGGAGLAAVFGRLSIAPWYGLLAGGRCSRWARRR
jgi:hypothetical protein